MNDFEMPREGIMNYDNFSHYDTVFRNESEPVYERLSCFYAERRMFEAYHPELVKTFEGSAGIDLYNSIKLDLQGLRDISNYLDEAARKRVLRRVERIENYFVQYIGERRLFEHNGEHKPLAIIYGGKSSCQE